MSTLHPLRIFPHVIMHYMVPVLMVYKSSAFLCVYLVRTYYYVFFSEFFCMKYSDFFYSVIGTIALTMWMNGTGTDMRLIALELLRIQLSP